MKSLEVFTLGKKIGHPAANEDSFVIVPDVGYAVIDGVTDRNGTRYDGMLAGRYASRTAGRAISRFLLGGTGGSLRYDGPEALVASITDALAQGYKDHGAYEAARDNPKLRAGCAVTLAFIVGDHLEIVAVGDSGIRINRAETLQGLKPLDDVTSRLRREAWHYFEAKGAPASECDALAGSITWQGTRHQPADSAAAASTAIEEIEKRALAVNRHALPDVPEWEMMELIQHGIANGQGNFQNVEDRALGYGVIDGFPVPARYIDTHRYKLADVETIELFSDGYFAPAEGFGVAAWEAAFERVEKEDPYKIGAYLSTKGTTASSWTDDRSYLGVRFK